MALWVSEAKVILKIPSSELERTLERRNRRIESSVLEAWKLYARVSPRGAAFDRGGLAFANAKQPWFLINVNALRTPATDEADLTRHAREASEYFFVLANPWELTGSQDWLGPKADFVLYAVGLVHKTDTMGMVAERLLHATRSFPQVELRRTSDEETRLALADLTQIRTKFS